MIFQFDHMGIDKDDLNCEVVDFDLVKLKTIFSKWQKQLNDFGWNSLYWSNHDQARIVSRFGNDSEYRIESAKMHGTTLHMLKGTPYIYQGEEIGITNYKFSDIDKFDDIQAKFHYNRGIKKGYSAKKILKYLNVLSRDHARIPISWNGKKEAGFTDGENWFKKHQRYQEVNVENALSDKNSVFYHYKKLVELRRKSDFSDIIAYGDYTVFDIDDGEVYSYCREYHGKTIIVVSNFTSEQLKRELNCEVRLVLSNYDKLYVEDGFIKLRPYESVMLAKE